MSGPSSSPTAPPSPSALRTVRQGLREPFDLASIVSLAVLVPSPERASLVLSTTLALVAALVVVVPAVRRSPWTWGLFAAVHGVTYVTDWYLLDNHDGLAAYWAIALAVAAAASTQRDEVIALQARWMLGITFLLATGWKLVSGQFMDGSFFTYALLVDARFRNATELVAGVPLSDVTANGEALAVAAASAAPSTVGLRGVAAVGTVVLLLTIGTVVVEGVLAVVMLLPDRPGRDLLRAATLGVFLVSTYAIVPVTRFGILLAAIGIGTAPARPRVRAALAGGAVVLAIWGWLWMELVGLT